MKTFKTLILILSLSCGASLFAETTPNQEPIDEDVILEPGERLILGQPAKLIYEAMEYIYERDENEEVPDEEKKYRAQGSKGSIVSDIETIDELIMPEIKKNQELYKKITSKQKIFEDINTLYATDDAILCYLTQYTDRPYTGYTVEIYACFSNEANNGKIYKGKTGKQIAKIIDPRTWWQRLLGL